MLLSLFDYIKLPGLSGELSKDIENILVFNNKQHILNHIRNVVKKSSELAEKFCLDKTMCEISGYCHDIAIIINPKDMLGYIKNNGMYSDKTEEKYPFLLHQRFSGIIAEELFGIKDERILSAITHHTTLKKNPSEYDMVLFIADKLCWDQEGMPPFYDIIINELNKSLQHASLAYIKYIFENNMILYPHLWLSEAYEWLKNTVVI
jgi:predicted HD superfamily hydrolase involved in NAD metabolism